MEKISRNAAFRDGKTRYFTGVKCSKGHIAEKMTSNGKCVICNREKLRKVREDLKNAAKLERSLEESLESMNPSIEASLKQQDLYNES